MTYARKKRKKRSGVRHRRYPLIAKMGTTCGIISRVIDEATRRGGLAERAGRCACAKARATTGDALVIALRLALRFPQKSNLFWGPQCTNSYRTLRKPERHERGESTGLRRQVGICLCPSSAREKETKKSKAKKGIPRKKKEGIPQTKRRSSMLLLFVINIDP